MFDKNQIISTKCSPEHILKLIFFKKKKNPDFLIIELRFYTCQKKFWLSVRQLSDRLSLALDQVMAWQQAMKPIINYVQAW